jgi:hypothetical protein
MLTVGNELEKHSQEQTNPAESSKEGDGSKRAVFGQ